MTTENRNELGKRLKQQRLLIPLTLMEVGAASGVSMSHLGRVERGERFPSARILRKIAKPLGFNEVELLALAGYLTQHLVEIKAQLGRIDPYVAAVLSQEPVEIQRIVVAILGIFKSMAKGIDL